MRSVVCAGNPSACYGEAKKRTLDERTKADSLIIPKTGVGWFLKT